MPLPALPPLDTARLQVREVEHADLPALMAVFGDAETTRHLPAPTWHSADDGDAWWRRVQGLVDAGGARQLVITAPASRQAIGTVLLFRHEPASRRIELGYALGRSHWGQGLAAEAVRAVLGHAFGALELHRVEAEVNPENRASVALLGRLGFTREGHLRDRWTAKGRTYGVDIFSLLAPEWHASS